MKNTELNINLYEKVNEPVPTVGQLPDGTYFKIVRSENGATGSSSIYVKNAIDNTLAFSLCGNFILRKGIENNTEVKIFSKVNLTIEE